jgi:hypothetical protein
MNERIKALMGKTLDSEFSHTWDTMTYEGLLQFSEKFAELIVKECIKEMGRYEFIDVAMREVKEHFGVE